MATPPVGAGLPAIAVVNLPHDRQIERWPGSLEVDKQAYRWQASSHRYSFQAGSRTMAKPPVGAGLPAMKTPPCLQRTRRPQYPCTPRWLLA
jgi:hypothetical protein